MRLVLPPDRGEIATQARAELLAEWMTSWLGEPVEVVVTYSYLELAEVIMGGDAHLAWAPPVVYAHVRSGLRFALTAEREGATTCCAALVVRRDDPARDVGDLAGRVGAWVDPLSLSGYLSAEWHARCAGFDLETHLSKQTFLGSYAAAVQAVVDGRADVTCIYGRLHDPEHAGVRRILSDVVGAGAERLRVLERTAPTPFDVLAGTEALSVEQARVLREKLLGLRRRAQNPSMLLSVCACDGFVDADPLVYEWLTRTSLAVSDGSMTRPPSALRRRTPPSQRR